MAQQEVLLKMVDITKTFPGVKALDHVSLEVEAGTVITVQLGDTSVTD